jgi:ATP adenylyltransferase
MRKKALKHLLLTGYTMKQLFSPWRSSYTKDKSRSKEEGATSEECVFCIQLQSNQDAEHFILKRYTYHAIMLNKYPYNAGHLLILPYAHVADLNDLHADAHHELMNLISACTTLLKAELSPDGMNIGLNIGKAAGAGIPAHMHTHVLPRFYGDTNFLPTLAGTKNIPFDLGTLYTKLKPHCP